MTNDECGSAAHREQSAAEDCTAQRTEGVEVRAAAETRTVVIFPSISWVLEPPELQRIDSVIAVLDSVCDFFIFFCLTRQCA